MSGNFLLALGVPLRAGRALGDADDMAGAPPAVVVSEPLWRDRFGAAALSGQTVMLNGQPFTVVGVAAARFSGMQVGRNAEFWVPLSHSPRSRRRRSSGRPTTSWLTLVGRLRDGATAESARQELDAILRRVRESSGRPVEPVVLQPGARGDSTLSGQLASPMALLLAAGALVLLVACLNVANLQLVTDRGASTRARGSFGARRTTSPARPPRAHRRQPDGWLPRGWPASGSRCSSRIRPPRSSRSTVSLSRCRFRSTAVSSRRRRSCRSGRAHHRPAVELADSSAAGR